MIFGQGFPDFGLAEWITLGLRIVASIGAAFVGWFLFDPLTRLGYRILFRGPTPGWILPWTKMTGALTLALLVFFFVRFGGGPGGLGFGFGSGGGPGKGPGDGSGKSNGTTKNADTTAAGKGTTELKATAELPTVQVEILGGIKHYEDAKKGRFYLWERKGSPLTIEEIDKKIQSAGKIQIMAVFTKDSPSDSSLVGGPYDKLQQAAKKHNIKVIRYDEPLEAP